MKIKAKLLGGPFDGDTGRIDVTPDELWVIHEEGDTAWYSVWVQGGELYRRSEGQESPPVRYVWADLREGGLLATRERSSASA